MRISQREASRLSKRVEELEQMIRCQRSAWGRKYPGGVNIGQLTRERDWFTGRVEAARLLGHAVVVTENADGILMFYALPLAVVKP